MTFRFSTKPFCRRIAIIAIVYLFTRFIRKSSNQTSMESNETAILFTEKPFVIWNNDYHPAPVVDARQLLEPLGVRFHVKILSDYCRFFNTCEERNKLKILNKRNYAEVNQSMVDLFFKAYKDDPEMNSVDAFLCYDPIFLCELFEPFNRSLIIIATGRYYVGRGAKNTWKRWNRKLIRLAASPHHVIGANNAYDVNIIRYYTGIEPVYLPNFCDYTRAVYRPTRPEYLLARRRPDPTLLEWFQREFDRATATKMAETDMRSRPKLVEIDRMYKRYSYEELASHRGIVHLPYQMSTMSILEQYRMNIPLFFPSISLLLSLNTERHVLVERTESIPRMAPHRLQRHLPSPINDSDVDALRYWFRFADYYTLPHIIYFDSVEQLVDLLGRMSDIDLLSISDRMKQYNVKAKGELIDKWRHILLNIAKYREK